MNQPHQPHHKIQKFGFVLLQVPGVGLEIDTVPFVNNEYGKRNRSFYVPKIFNSLPEPLLKLEKIKKLKKLLKQHFLQQTVR